MHLHKYVQHDLSVPKNHCRCENENRMSKKSFSSDKALQKDWVTADFEVQSVSYFNVLSKFF